MTKDILKNKGKKNGLEFVWLAALVIIADQVSKYIILSKFNEFESIQILPFLNFTLVFNTGAAFSFLDSQAAWKHYFLGAIAFVAIFVILVWLYRLDKKDFFHVVSLNLVLGGAIGNLIDRFVQAKVTDFIHFHIGDWSFAIFNVADAAISVGATILVITILFKKEDKKA